jgi:hypothetical protein
MLQQQNIKKPVSHWAPCLLDKKQQLLWSGGSHSHLIHSSLPDGCISKETKCSRICNKLCELTIRTSQPTMPGINLYWNNSLILIQFQVSWQEATTLLIRGLSVPPETIWFKPSRLMQSKETKCCRICNKYANNTQNITTYYARHQPLLK